MLFGGDAEEIGCSINRNNQGEQPHDRPKRARGPRILFWHDAGEWRKLGGLGHRAFRKDIRSGPASGSASLDRRLPRPNVANSAPLERGTQFRLKAPAEPDLTILVTNF